MEDLANKVLERGQFLIPDEEHYRLGGYTVIEDDDPAKNPYVPLEIDLAQPSWVPANCAATYQTTAHKLFQAAREQIPIHVVLGEILRAADCRLTEILFLCALYPERDWVDRDKQLSFSKKLRLGKRILPRKTFPVSLVRDLARIRNLAEHQFSEPTLDEMQKALETMNMFLELTNRMLEIIGYCSMFKYKADDAGTVIVLQMMRENGSILLFHDGEKPKKLQGIPAQSDLGISLVGNVLAKLKSSLDTDHGFMSKLGFTS